MSEVSFKSLGVYLVEGVVEVDPITDRPYVRTVDDRGEPVDFDPTPVLQSLKGVEVRVIVVPLASVAQLEDLARKAEVQGEQITVIDAPNSDSN